MTQANIPLNRLAIDVSNVNPISLQELRQASPQLLIAKATEGTSFKDDTYESHRSIARTYSCQFGSYLFLHPNSPGSEAQYYLDFAKPTIHDAIFVDVETTDGVGMDRVARRALECLKYLRAHAPSDPLIYCSASWWKTLVAYEPELKSYAIWEAQYPGAFTRWTPALATLRIKLRNGATVKLWQWTDHYRVGNRYFDASRMFAPAV